MQAQKTRRIGLRPGLMPAVAGLVFVTVAAGCGVWQMNVSAQHRSAAEEMEPLLEQAGFIRLPAQTPAQVSEMNSLKPLAISRSFDPKKGTRYWFADPYDCRCMYAGNEAAFERYRDSLRTQRVRDQMRADNVLNQEAFDQVSEVSEINMFNPVFSP